MRFTKDGPQPWEEIKPDGFGERCVHVAELRGRVQKLPCGHFPRFVQELGLLGEELLGSRLARLPVFAPLRAAPGHVQFKLLLNHTNTLFVLAC